jgi:hypothetical protein
MFCADGPRTHQGFGAQVWGGGVGSPPGPEVQSTPRLRADYFMRTLFAVTRAAPRARDPAGALARGIARTPPEGGCRAARRYAHAQR